MFFKKKSKEKATIKGDYQEILVIVDKGYQPETIVLQKGIPANIIFERRSASPCLSQVVFSDFDVKADLPLNERCTITIEPNESGSYPFSCGMDMYHGTVLVK